MGDGNIALGDRDKTREPGLRGEQIVVAGVQAAVRDTIADREELADRVKEEAKLHGPEQCLRASDDALEALDDEAGHGIGHREIAAVALHGRVEGECPHDDLFGRLHAWRAHPLVGDQATREVHHGAGMGLDLGEALRPAARLRPHPDCLQHGIQGIVEALPDNRAGASANTESARGLANEERGVLHPGQGRLGKERLFRHLPAGVAQGDEVAGEIAAIDR